MLFRNAPTMKDLRGAGLLEPEQRYRGNGGKSSPLFDYHVFNMLLQHNYIINFC